jgi:drug/metabolite transporter (DMT)-like permease
LASIFSSYAGELAALSAAFIWAMASVIWSRVGRDIRAVELNLFKGLLAIVLLFFTLLATGESVTRMGGMGLVLFLISGAVGIGLGDTAYFESLKNIGPRRTLLMGTLAPPMTGLLAWACLGERLSLGAWAGILVTVLGVAWVISDRGGAAQMETGAVVWRGLVFALLADLAQATGAVLSRFAFLSTSVSPLQSSFIRLGAGTLLAAVWLIVLRQPVGRWTKNGGLGRVWVGIAAATFLGTYLGVWLQQISLNLAQTGIGQTLISTSPLFVFIPAALMGEKISLRAVTGVIVALVGVGMLFGLR